MLPIVLPLSHRLGIGLLAFVCWTAGAWAESLSARVIILANRADPDSMRLAYYYATQREIPADNILAFGMSASETIDWPEFVATLWQPLQDGLIERKWIDATGSRLLDAAGRKKYAINGHRVAYLVVCRGVPLRLSHEPALLDSAATALPEFIRTNQAAVDSELALLASNQPAINGVVSNPLFQNDRPSNLQRNEVVKVSRLDGPSFDDARAMVDHAIAAERIGLMGRAYVDIGGVHPEGDRWLETVAAQVSALGFETDIDRRPETFADSARCDAPAFYFGWYASQLNGPLALPDFHFPPGAVALHIHSYSATTLRSATSGWSGPLIARGVTATVGNVFEPYLQLTHRPDLLLAALIRGENFGDAAAYACPAFSWQAIALGDPLYRPFAVNLRAELQESGNSLSGYAALRQAHLLDREGKTDAALSLVRKAWNVRHDAAVGLDLVDRLGDSGATIDRSDVLSRTADQAIRDSLATDRWALLASLADRLVQNAQPAKAVEVYQKLFTANLPLGLRGTWMGPAREAARAAHDDEALAAWSEPRTMAPSSKNKEGGSKDPP